MKNLLTSFFIVVCAAQAALVPVRSRLTILTRGPAGLRIEGKSAEVSMEDQTSALVFRAPVAAIDTGIGLRNRHLREALEAEKFPLATLRMPRAGLALPAEAPVESSAPAELTLHGQTRPVTVRYRAVRDAGLTQAVASLRLDVRDFGIEPPSYLGVRVAPEVEVQVDMAVELR